MSWTSCYEPESKFYGADNLWSGAVPVEITDYCFFFYYLKNFFRMIFVCSDFLWMGTVQRRVVVRHLLSALRHNLQWMIWRFETLKTCWFVSTIKTVLCQSPVLIPQCLQKQGIFIHNQTIMLIYDSRSLQGVLTVCKIFLFSRLATNGSSRWRKAIQFC